MKEMKPLLLDSVELTLQGLQGLQELTLLCGFEPATRRVWLDHGLLAHRAATQSVTACPAFLLTPTSPVFAGADAKARTRDGLTPSACVGLDSKAKRSKKVAQEDEELRGMLEDLEYE